jgi:hypothetical protein
MTVSAEEEPLLSCHLGVVLGLAAATAACLPFKDDPSDAGASGGMDGPALGPRCDPNKPFGAPVFVPGLDSAIEMAPVVGGMRLSRDELTLYFYAAGIRGAMDSHKLYAATRGSSGDPFGAAALLAGASQGINSEDFDQRDPTVSGDGLTLVFARGPRGLDTVSIQCATRTDPSSDFAYVGPVSGVNDPGRGHVGPFLRQDGEALYFAATVGLDASVPVYEIERANRNGSCSYDAPVPVQELNSNTVDYFPVVTPNDLTIFFSSHRPYAQAAGKGDIWTATRSSGSEPFSTLRPLTELNTDQEDVPTYVTSDGCQLYFAVFTIDAAYPYGNFGAYVAAKPP